jgi:RNA polymerase sigma-70 factor, ECF subfamily
VRGNLGNYATYGIFGTLPVCPANHARMSRSATDLDPSDQELLRRAVAGERDAFAALYRRYQHVVYRFACVMTGSSDAAEDVTQEVFVALIRELPRYDPTRAALATYLYGVARNVSRDRLRRERRFVTLSTLDADEAGQVEGAGLVDKLAEVQATTRLRRALAALPSRYREVIILCDVEEIPYADAARIVRTAVGTVRSRLHRGRQMLAERVRRLDQRTTDQARCSA